MALDRDLVERWAAALEEVKAASAQELVLESGAVSVASIGDADVRVPAGVAATISAYEVLSDTLAAQALALGMADGNAQRALATIAAGDFDAAAEALQMDSQLRGADEGLEIVPASVADPPPAPDVDEYVAELLALDVRGAATQPTGWLSPVQQSLDAVVVDAAGRMVDLGTSTLVSAVGGQLADGASQLFDGRLTGILDAVGSGLSWLKQKALTFIRKGIEKVSALFGEETKDAVQSWIGNTASALPADLLGQWVGVPETVAHWQDSHDAGADMTARLGGVTSSEAGHRKQLARAGRATAALALVYPAIHAVAVSGVPQGLLAAALVVVGLGGWMFWAAWDHSQDVRRLAA